MLSHNAGRCSRNERKRMPRSPHDQAIVAHVLPQLTTWSKHKQEKRVTYNRQGRVYHLDLGGLGLTTLFPEISWLSELRRLDLQHNQLTSLPGELGQLLPTATEKVGRA